MSTGTKVVQVNMPKIFKGIKQPHRYKVFYGGRGSGKSQSVARYLLLSGKQEPMRILCAREFQSSIKESVKQLLEDLIVELELSDFYQIFNTEIRGINGTSIVFAGLRHNISNIKSMHDVKKCWVEEAQVVSDASWSILIPTIRAEGSEIILTMNPELSEDPTYQRFVVSPPPDTLILKVNYTDNPYFPDVLRQEMEFLKAKDFQEYLHIWEGQPKAAVEGAIFTIQLQQAQEQGRITDDVEYNASVPVNTYWDLGKSDKTAIWFAQYSGMQWRILGHYSNFLQPLEHYIEYIQSQPYNYGRHFLPHDARQDRLGMQRSVEDQVRAELKNVEVVERTTHKVNSIEAAKAIFPICHFHKTNCADGISDLRHYRYALDPQTGKIGKNPLHDIHSDSCFVAGTMITTGRGDVPIEEVQRGDTVWTPCGFAVVEKAGAVKQATHLIRIVTDNGFVTCTPEHKFFTNRGLVNADALRYSDCIWTQKFHHKLSSADENTGYREGITRLMSGELTQTPVSIGQSGASTMGQSLKAMMSTIKTGIKLIMLSRIWNALKEASTDQSIPKQTNGIALGEMWRFSLPELFQSLRNGMRARRDTSGMSNMEERLGQNANGSVRFALNANVHSERHGEEQKCAPRIVATELVSAEGTKTLVYDLSVKDHHCYLANGLLVSNCDAFQCFAMAAQPEYIEEAEVTPFTSTVRLG